MLKYNFRYNVFNVLKDSFLINEMVDLFIEEFSNYPFFEKFSKIEINGYLNNILGYSNGTIIYATHAKNLVGFACGYPVKYEPNIRKVIEKYINPTDCFYNSQLVVYKKFRDQGVGRNLVVRRINYAQELKFKRVVVRVSQNVPSVIHLYETMGFIKLKDTQLVSRLRISGKQDIDERYFYYKNIF